MSALTMFAWFENQRTDKYEIHAPQCACIKKHIANFVVDSGNINRIEAASGKDAMLRIIAEWASYEEDFNGSESGEAEQYFKVFPCASKAVAS
jgi:hypothetical protein